MRPAHVVICALLSGCGLELGGMGPSGDAALDGAFLDVSTDDAFASDGGGLDASGDAITDSSGGDTGPADTGPADTGPDAGPDSGPILTITGGSYGLLGLDAGPCSTSGATAASFSLVNQRDASVDLQWVNYQCGEQAYGVIAPMGSKNQGTYVTHVWRIRNDADSKFLAGFVLNAAGPYTVTVH